jgi:RNA polymerase sigma-70 factor, ECF subfamily
MRSDPLGAEPILARVARGDPRAVRECVETYGGLVWSLARRSGVPDAEDAVQEIFVDLWKSAGRFKPVGASEAAFVAMIARRRLIDRRRRVGREPLAAAGDELSAVADPAAAPDRCAEAALATRALGQLRPEQREVLLLAACDGLSHDEIATQVGIPLGTVKSHVRRALLRIRAALLGEGEEEAEEVPA